MAIATFAAGCFWGVEYHFQQIPGVTDTRVGYIGGHTNDPDYKKVCAGDTNHAEAIEITYDGNVISYDDLLQAFWECHDPTQKNRQGPDVGTQYRSAIFTHSEEQASAARISLTRHDAAGVFSSPIATEIVPATTFYEAEDYHQSYVKKKRAKMGMSEA
ncbi:peptide-methionine (S)-S-oxide reductase MsrA [Kiloniella sp. b19]|uniref:peptide-methionine (S)-S-oxide reductase MsrA n=1 Tax=Kiloniella sp. GXU_MW_B19 TaxID=3141326 RepID=UPI0031D75323